MIHGIADSQAAVAASRRVEGEERLPRTEALQRAAQHHGFIHEVWQAVITVTEDVGRVRQMACMAGR